jgi:hypothetical protein
LPLTIRAQHVLDRLGIDVFNPGLVYGRVVAERTWVRCGVDYVVPFLVSNAGVLSDRR